MKEQIFIAPRTTLFFKSIQKLHLESPCVLITDENVDRLYAEAVQTQLKKFWKIVVPAGEEIKNRETKQKIEDEMFALGLGRDTTVIALGGGVVLDLAGFVAATFCRGVELICIPTTLLAMVDAAIGGKTGVNTPLGKNLIGAFYPASQIWIDPTFLQTLPPKEWLNGYAEIIKYGLIASPELFASLQQKPADPLPAIFESIHIKKKTIEEDFREGGKRRILNFGHTIGHAVETVLSYSISHGEAVAKGIAFESYLSMRMGSLTSKAYASILALLENYGFCVGLSVPFEAMLKVMTKDKKAVQAQTRFVLLEGIGSAMRCGGEYCMPVEGELLKEAYEQFSH